MLLCRWCHGRSGCINARSCEMKFTFGPVSYGLCEACQSRDFTGANADARQERVDCTTGLAFAPSAPPKRQPQ